MEWHEFQAFLHELSIRSSNAALKKIQFQEKIGVKHTKLAAFYNYVRWPPSLKKKKK